MAARDYQQFDTRESSTGARLKSANRRSLVQITAPQHIIPGLNTAFNALPNPEGPINGDPNLWRLVNLRRYRFKASCIVSVTGGQDVISLENAALQIIFPDDAKATQGYGTAARLSATTALAAQQLFSIDDFVMDGSDVLAMLDRAPSLSGLSHADHVFRVQIEALLNNTGVAAWDATLAATWDYNTADFDSYRFDKWE